MAPRKNTEKALAAPLPATPAKPKRSPAAKAGRQPKPMEPDTFSRVMASDTIIVEGTAPRKPSTRKRIAQISGTAATLAIDPLEVAAKTEPVVAAAASAPPTAQQKANALRLKAASVLGPLPLMRTKARKPLPRAFRRDECRRLAKAVGVSFRSAWPVFRYGAGR